MNELVELAGREARRLARRWPALDAADIQQEILLYAWEHGLDAPEMPVEGTEGGTLTDVYLAEVQALRFALRDAGAQYCKRQERDRRRERAAILGYETEDEAFYSLSQLRLLVEAYFSHGVTERPAISRADSVSRTGDPAEGGTWAASLVDIERALKGVSEGYRVRLYERYYLMADLADEQVGWQSGLSEGQVRGRIRTALQALQKELGGASPWNRGPTPKNLATPVATA